MCASVCVYASVCVCEGSSHPVAGQSIDKKAERASTKEKRDVDQVEQRFGAH